MVEFDVINTTKPFKSDKLIGDILVIMDGVDDENLLHLTIKNPYVLAQQLYQIYREIP